VLLDFAISVAWNVIMSVVENEIKCKNLIINSVWIGKANVIGEILRQLGPYQNHSEIKWANYRQCKKLSNFKTGHIEHCTNFGKCKCKSKKHISRSK
jgi:hypothetical protein